jgi:hypothetical protein
MRHIALAYRLPLEDMVHKPKIIWIAISMHTPMKSLLPLLMHPSLLTSAALLYCSPCFQSALSLGRENRPISTAALLVSRSASTFYLSVCSACVLTFSTTLTAFASYATQSRYRSALISLFVPALHNRRAPFSFLLLYHFLIVYPQARWCNCGKNHCSGANITLQTSNILFFDFPG